MCWERKHPLVTLKPFINLCVLCNELLGSLLVLSFILFFFLCLDLPVVFLFSELLVTLNNPLLTYVFHWSPCNLPTLVWILVQQFTVRILCVLESKDLRLHSSSHFFCINNICVYLLHCPSLSPKINSMFSSPSTISLPIRASAFARLINYVFTKEKSLHFPPLSSMHFFSSLPNKGDCISSCWRY